MTSLQWISVIQHLCLFSLFSVVFSCYVINVIFFFLAKNPSFMLVTGASSLSCVKLHCKCCQVRKQSPEENAELCTALVHNKYHSSQFMPLFQWSYVVWDTFYQSRSQMAFFFFFYIEFHISDCKILLCCFRAGQDSVRSQSPSPTAWQGGLGK